MVWEILDTLRFTQLAEPPPAGAVLATDLAPEGSYGCDQRRACTRRGDGAETFEEFFRLEYPTLVRLLSAMTHDVDEAEELAQETMARVYERWTSVRQMSSPGGYAYRTALNLNRNRVRHLRVHARTVLQADARTADPELHGELLDALASLPRPQREAVLLVEWLGLDATEAGAILGIAPTSVRSRVSRAKSRLRAAEARDEK